jgi:hypothetical protein
MLWNPRANAVPKHKTMQQKKKINVQPTTVFGVLVGHHPQ